MIILHLITCDKYVIASGLPAVLNFQRLVTRVAYVWM